VNVRPVVGMTASEQEVRYGAWQRRATFVASAYLDMVQGAGGTGVLLAPGTAHDAGSLLGRIDALVLTGGVDVDPALYGQVAHSTTEVPDRRRDGFEVALLRAARGTALPVLAICRGLQVLNVARGGTLHQHLPEVMGHHGHRQAEGSYRSHRVRIEPGTRLSEVLGRAEAEVPAHHHQGIDRLGEGLTVSATADDGLVEAVEDPASPFVVGVQWHPEAGHDGALFDALVAAART